MSDPAIEAARKAVNGGLGFPNGPVDAFAIQSAREALKPIRKESEQLLNPNVPQMSRLWWDGVQYALERIAPLIYSTEELEDMKCHNKI